MRDATPFETTPLGLVRDRTVSLALLLLPPAILGAAAAGYESALAVVGASAGLLGSLLLLRHRHVWRPPASGLLIALYLIALGWLWFVTRHEPDGVARLGRGVLLFAAMALFVGHDLVRTGLEPRRRGRAIVRRLLRRTTWPVHPGEYAHLPEVRALADVLQDDPGPAAELLAADRVEVRLAAATALQQRTYWRDGEADLVLDALDRTPHPGVRAAGLKALATATDGGVLGVVGEYLRDKAPEVRRAAAVALMADAPGRWPLVREAIRAALSDPQQARDGALPGAPGAIDGVAVCDLTTWAAEPGALGERSLQTLIGHYGVVLHAGTRPELASEICQQVVDAQMPPQLRVELAHLLRGLGLITPDLLDRMTDIDQPGAIRILAAEMLLAWDPTNPDAIDVLRGLGRQPNRETALVIARLVQQYLRHDLGLPTGPVATNSKAAAEVARRVLQWATGRATAVLETTPGDAGDAWVARPATAPALPSTRSMGGPLPPPRPGRGSSQELRRRRPGDRA
jgi:hypothetical protein